MQGVGREVDFEPTDRCKQLLEHLRTFMEEPLAREVARDTPSPQILVELRERAKGEGLWNLFLPDRDDLGPGLTNGEYGVLCEEMGRSSNVAPYVFNCQPPDSGNMEILAEHARGVQRDRWLEPLLDGSIRSIVSMAAHH